MNPSSRIHRTIAGAAALFFLINSGSLLLAVAPARADDSDSSPVALAHKVKVAKANQLIYRWQAAEGVRMNDYLAKRETPGGPNEDFDLQVDFPQVPMHERSLDAIQRDDRTHELVEKYYGHQGLDRYHGTFVESGAAFSSGYQWNTQRNAGFLVKSVRDQFLDQALANKLINIRFGINIHELNLKDPRTLDGILDFHREAWRRGISLTDSVLFFSGLRALDTHTADGKVDPRKSFENNSQFPEYAEKMADFVLTAVFKEQAKFNRENASLPIASRRPTAHTAVNPINEPETFAGFNQFWNGGFAQWSDPNFMQLYVPTIINIAKANVGIRRAVERAAHGEDILIFHNEAMTPVDYPSHLGDLQFAVSKLMLGDEQLMNADFDKLQRESIQSIQQRFNMNKQAGNIDVVEAAILHFVLIPANDSPAKIDSAKRWVIAQLKDLRQRHVAFTKDTETRANGRLIKAGKTAKTNTIVMFDYYQQSEFILPQVVPEMIRDFSANQGEKLKEVMKVTDNGAFLRALETRTRQAEAAVGYRIWDDFSDISKIDFVRLLSSEDGAVLDKVVGLRNDWNLTSDPILAARRARANFDSNKSFSGDEKRVDGFLNALTANGGHLLKTALDIRLPAQSADNGDAALLQQLQIIGQDVSRGGPSVSVTSGQSLRDILNASERTVLYRAFGLERQRRVGFLPPHYARQTRAGMRKGFYRTFLKYVDQLGIRIGGIGESGTPYYPWAATVHKQMMYELAAGMKASDFYMVRNDLGPAWGTVGWMNGPMTGNLKTNGRRGEDGIFKIVRLAPYKFEFQLSSWPNSEPWYSTYRREFEQGMIASMTPAMAAAYRVQSAAEGAAIETPEKQSLRPAPAQKVNLQRRSQVRTCSEIFGS